MVLILTSNTAEEQSWVKTGFALCYCDCCAITLGEVASTVTSTEQKAVCYLTTNQTISVIEGN